MDADELNAPLGRSKERKSPKAAIGLLQVLTGALALCLLVVAGWALLANDPLGGEPVAVVTADAGPAAATRADDAAPTGHARYDGPEQTVPVAADAARKSATHADADRNTANGARTVTIIDGSSGARKEIVLPDSGAATNPPDKRLLETTPQGVIPKVAADGTRASSFYAQPRKLPPGRGDTPQIAIVLGGLGISAAATDEALARLPAPITLAISPYGGGLERLAERARALGHELLLQVPMEPFDYPNNDPGPRALLTSLSNEQNVERLHWLMSRFQGYVGLIGYMGDKFTASEKALTPVLQDAARRGLLYVDDGTSPRSNAGQIAGSNNMPFAKADIVLDAVPTRMEIDRALARLELAAREHGLAVGYASAQSTTIAAIAQWAKAVEQRGFALVPISMAAVPAKPT